MMKKTCVLLLSLLVLAACRSGGPVLGKPERDSSRFYINLGKGVAALERNEYATAVQFLRLAVAERPGSAKALNLRGIAYLMSGKVHEARVDFEKVITLDPAYGPAYQNLGCTLVKEMKLDEAEAILRRALDRFPASASAYFTLGSILISLNRADEALAVMRRGLELDPAFFSTEKKFMAESDLLGTDRPELLFSYARLFAAAGDVGKAVENLRLAKKAGFKDWQRIRTLSDFDPVRADPALEEFLK
jgi:Flp pilus assembly protein TadD